MIFRTYVELGNSDEFYDVSMQILLKNCKPKRSLCHERLPI